MLLKDHHLYLQYKRFFLMFQARSTAIKEVGNIFSALQLKILLSRTKEELLVSVPKWTTFYDELSEVELLKDILRMRRHMKAADIDLHKGKDWSVLMF